MSLNFNAMFNSKKGIVGVNHFFTTDLIYSFFSKPQDAFYRFK